MLKSLQIQNYALIDQISLWLKLIAELPWGVESTDNLSIDEAKRVLDAGHFGRFYRLLFFDGFKNGAVLGD